MERNAFEHERWKIRGVTLPLLAHAHAINPTICVGGNFVRAAGLLLLQPGAAAQGPRCGISAVAASIRGWRCAVV